MSTKTIDATFQYIIWPVELLPAGPVFSYWAQVQQVYQIVLTAELCRLHRFVFGCLSGARPTLSAGNYDRNRAELVNWLSRHEYKFDTAAVNADLDTAMHCATRSKSPATLQVMLSADQQKHAAQHISSLYYAHGQSGVQHDMMPSSTAHHTHPPDIL